MKHFSVAGPGILKRAGGGLAEFLGSGDCIDAPSHVPYVFVVRVESKINIVNFALIDWI